jgi:hypothetical protein
VSHRLGDTPVILREGIVKAMNSKSGTGKEMQRSFFAADSQIRYFYLQLCELQPILRKLLRSGFFFIEVM